MKSALLTLIAVAIPAVCLGATRSAARTETSSVPAFRHVIVIVFDKREVGDVLGNRRARNLNRLASRYARISRYTAVAHPSLPNYLALVSGSTHGIHSDCTQCLVRGRSLADTLQAARKSWKTYAEGLPSRGFTRPAHRGYVKNHNPFLYFRRNLTRARLQRIVPLSQFGRDLRRRRLPSYSLVIPNLCHDMHNCGVATGDAWLGRFVKPLLRGSVLEKSVIFVTFDEGKTRRGGGGRVAALALGPVVRPGARVARPTNHYGLLRTIEDGLGLQRLGRSAGAKPILGIWREPPVDTALPTISGTARDGQALIASPGTWSGRQPISYAYQWRRCDAGGGACSNIGSAGGQSYTLGAADVGSTFRVAVTASNADGSATAVSAQTGAVVPAAPSNTAAPTISGTAQAGLTLSAAPGSWSGTPPLSYAYQWRRCGATGEGCSDISGANTQSYTLAAADIGATVRVAVTASNAGGSSTSSSSQTAPVTAVIAAGGDIACDPASSFFNGGLGTATNCRQRYTSDLLVGSNLTAVLALGDEQYECGGFSAFMQSYNPSWGRTKSITHPVPGNREYLATSSGGTDCDGVGHATGYYKYFGAAAGDPSKGYYSYDLGNWHLIALNSNCAAVGGCGAGSAQETWLRADLAAHPAPCTLAYWHHPRYSSGSVGNDSTYHPFWQDLYNAGAELVLVGHDHDYERFAPQNAASPPAADSARGVRELVVGTGGEDFRAFSTIRANSQVRQNTTFGILKLTLHSNGYDWQFVPEAGKTFTDSGTTVCH